MRQQAYRVLLMASVIVTSVPTAQTDSAHRREASKMEFDHSSPLWHIVEAGQKALMPCPVKGHLVSVSWTKGGFNINARVNDRYEKVVEPRGQLHFERGSLLIHDTQEGDTGVYHCRAVSGWGYLDQNVTLVVCNSGCKNAAEVQRRYGIVGISQHELSRMGSELGNVHEKRIVAPYFHQRHKPRQLIALVGEDTSLTCHARGKPKPRLRWETSSVLRVRRNLGHRSRSIKLDTSTPQSLNYTCIASNDAGQARVTYSVKVVRHDPEMKFVNPPPRNLTVLVGSDVNLTCHIRSRTQPIVSWFKRLEMGTKPLRHQDIRVQNIRHAGKSPWFRPQNFITTSKHGRDGTTVTSHMLQLHQVTSESQGAYYCVISKIHSIEYRIAQLRVVNSRSELLDSGVSWATPPPKESSFNALPVVISIAGGVVVILLVVLACVCRRQKLSERAPKHNPHESRVLQANYDRWDV